MLRAAMSPCAPHQRVHSMFANAYNQQANAIWMLMLPCHVVLLYHMMLSVLISSPEPTYLAHQCLPRR